MRPAPQPILSRLLLLTVAGYATAALMGLVISAAFSPVSHHATVELRPQPAVFRTSLSVRP